MKKFLIALVSFVLVVSTGCSKSETTSSTTTESSSTGAEYTLNTYQGALATNWNPHTWEMDADSAVLDYVTTPWITYSLCDSDEGTYQVIFEAATSIEDVTAEHQDDLTKYNVTLPDGVTDPSEVTDGYVWKIHLNPDMKWENGEEINADTYMYSFEQLLNPDMKNYRANNYYTGDYAVAGAYDYFYSKDAGTYVNPGDFSDYSDDEIYVNVWDIWGAEGYTDEDGNECPNYVLITDTTVYNNEDGDDPVSGADVAGYLGSYPEYFAVYQVNDKMGATFDQVGFYKVDDYTVMYVTQNHLTIDYLYYSLTSNFLVYEPYYEANKETTGELVTTSYGTSVDTTMSYGPYKLASLQDDKQMVLERNDNWYPYHEEDGEIVAYSTDLDPAHLVDGESVPVYQTSRIVIDVMDDDAAKQAFLKGELSSWTPSADDLTTYNMSDQLYTAPESFTLRYFFDTNVEDLQEMDKSKGNTNSVVMSNENFRKAMSLAIDRSEYVTATPGYTPAFYLINSSYYYNIFEDPTSQYRSSDAAKKAIVDFYNIEYGSGKTYADLDTAYDSITGYNLTEAKELMKQACDELVAAGLYTAGEDIYIRIGWTSGTITSAYQQEAALLTKFVNAAAEGSGFGTFTFEPIGNLSNRYADVANGEFAIGRGAWGGAVFDPFSYFQVYFDPDYTDIHEAACWDPTTETLTLNVNGEDVTMTWQAWSSAMSAGGKFANESQETKLQITADLEENFLEKYYCIPLAVYVDATMLSYKVSYYTDEYNIMYGFGGLELMTYNYNDEEWDAFVAEKGGTLNYE